MAKERKHGKLQNKQFAALILIYACCAGLRFLFSCLTSEYPSVGIDEFLYYSLGRSIANSGSLLYRAQPAQYPYILYPALLAPVYALFPAGTDFYRLIQLWNSLLMNAAIFPIYGICRRIIPDGKKTLIAAAASMLLPDFMLSGFIFSEVLIYPLFFTLFYEIIQAAYEKKNGRFIWIGVLGACLYFTKPGAIVPAAVALLLFCGEGIRRRNRRELAGVALGIGSLAATFAVIGLVLRFGMGYKGSLLGVYDLQLETADGLNLKRFAQTAALYPYYFMIACGIIPGVTAVLRWQEWGRENRSWMKIWAISLGIVMIGTAWLINRREDTHILFLRYMDMYLPLGLMACFLPATDRTEQTEQNKRRARLCAVFLLAYTVICTAVAGSKAGIDQKVEDHFQLGVAMLCLDNVKGIADLLIYFLCGVSVFSVFRQGWKRHIARIVFAVTACVVVSANLSGYIINYGNANHLVGDEGRRMKEIIGDHDYLYVFTNDKVVGDGGLNVYSKNNISWVSMNDFFNNLSDDGAYEPFVPVSNRGMEAENPTPDVERIVFDNTVYPLIQFNDNARITLSPEKRYCVARFEKGTRIVDSILGNVFVQSLAANTPGVLIVYKEEWLTKPVQLTFDLESPVDQTMTFLSDKFDYQIPLVKGRNKYAFNIANPDEYYNISVDTEQIVVHGYEIKADGAD